MIGRESYKPRQFDLSGLVGISDKTLEMHFKLYEGYVKNTNAAHREDRRDPQGRQVDQEEMPAYSELTRRLGFEYNGMVLHEYYFGNMKRHGGGDPATGVDVPARPSRRASAATTSGRPTSSASARCAASAGPICYQDPANGSSRITGSRCTRSATSPASCRSW